MLQESRIFSSLRSAQNLDSLRGLVKISTNCFSVLTWWISMYPLVSWSLKKWCRISICFVLEWFTGLFAGFMALSLSHNNGILVKWHLKSWRVCLIQSSWTQHTPAATYSASAVDSATQFCFLELQDTRDRPTNWHVPKVSPKCFFYLLCNWHNRNPNSQVDWTWSP
jgi:hypothetical protein